jgi:hypothetical protein
VEDGFKISHEVALSKVGDLQFALVDGELSDIRDPWSYELKEPEKESKRVEFS